MSVFRCVTFLTTLVLIQDGFALPTNLQRRAMHRISDHMLNENFESNKRSLHDEQEQHPSAEQELEALLLNRAVEHKSHLEEELQGLHQPFNKDDTNEERDGREQREEVELRELGLPKEIVVRLPNNHKRNGKQFSGLSEAYKEDLRELPDFFEKKDESVDHPSIREQIKEENDLNGDYKEGFHEIHGSKQEGHKAYKPIREKSQREIHQKHDEEVLREIHPPEEDESEEREIKSQVKHEKKDSEQENHQSNHEQRSNEKVDDDSVEVLQAMHPQEEDEEEERKVHPPVHHVKKQEKRQIHGLNYKQKRNGEAVDDYKEVLRELHPPKEDEEEEREVHPPVHHEKKEDQKEMHHLNHEQRSNEETADRDVKVLRELHPLEEDEEEERETHLPVHHEKKEEEQEIHHLNHEKRSNEKAENDHIEVLQELQPDEAENEKREVHPLVNYEKKEEEQKIHHLNHEQRSNEKVRDDHVKALRELHLHEEEEEREINAPVHHEKKEEKQKIHHLNHEQISSGEKHMHSFSEEHTSDKKEQKSHEQEHLLGNIRETYQPYYLDQENERESEEEDTDRAHQSRRQDEKQEDLSDEREDHIIPYSPEINEPNTNQREAIYDSSEEEYQKKRRLLAKLEIMSLMKRNDEVPYDIDDKLFAEEDTNDGTNIKRVSPPIQVHRILKDRSMIKRNFIKPFVEPISAIDDDEVHAFDDEEGGELKRTENFERKKEEEMENAFEMKRMASFCNDCCSVQGCWMIHREHCSNC